MFSDIHKKYEFYSYWSPCYIVKTDCNSAASHVNQFQRIIDV